jgi:hypothetical protein
MFVRSLTEKRFEFPMISWLIMGPEGGGKSLAGGQSVLVKSYFACRVPSSRGAVDSAFLGAGSASFRMAAASSGRLAKLP